MRKIIHILILVLILAGYGYSQTKTNIDKLYDLIEKSVSATLAGKVEIGNKVFIDFTIPERFQLLKNSLLEKTALAATVNAQKENSEFIFTYTIEDAKVKYSDTFTESFLGRNYVEREVSLKGFSGLNKPAGNPAVNHFDYTEKDTVEYRNLKELGNPAYPFTSPEIPSEPFFSSILEPIIAIGVAVTTVYLLFTVRSK